MVWTLSIINTAPQGISFPPQHPVSNAPCPSAMTYISADETHEHSRVISSSQNNELCAKHGLKDMALGSMHPLKSIDSHAVGSDCHHAGNTASISTAENRLYRSLENLHWAAVSDSAVYTHYRSVDSDFTLHCRSTRHMSEGSAARAPVHSMAETCGHAGERIAVHKDLPVPPIAKGHHWLFPTADDKLLHGDAKRELKEKLRIHSSKVVEPNRPVRPPTFLPNCVAKESAKNKTCQHCKCVCRVPCSSAPALAKSIMPVTRQCTSILYNRTSPEQIKREAIRRLQLRRQNSSPNLTVHHAEKETRGMVKSKTTESFNEQRHCSGRVWAADTRRKLCSKGRLYIPTFEEFKRMRNREKGYLSKSDVCLDNMESTASKIPEPEWNTNTHLPMTMEIQNHTLEATDLSGYGAKLQKMKDGLIGSALDLIKKSCSAETAAEPPARVSYDLPKTDTTSPEENNQSPAVSMATQSRQATPNTEDLTDTKPTGSPCSPGCRRSSSDMTHEAVDTGKTQRGCRLRPHFSDPMPTDAVKRKQLELKIAAAARHHAQRRRQDKGNGPVLTKAITTTSCRSGKEGGYTPGHSQRSRHRWSNMSSLSTDSGVVGMNDERDESEASGTEAAKPGEVERADSGIGDALSRKWRARVSEATASLEAWEAHRPCLDCGERDSAQDTESRGKRRETLCVKCVTRRTERKEAVLEFVNTEASYGEDLRIIKEEFYLPMQTAGLLAQEQLQVVFSNIQELIDLSEKFLEVLQEEIDQSLDQGDDDLMTVCIGEIFLEFVNMLPAFQTYCLQQSASVTMLNALEKEKELLRIFLDVSQNDNTALRRMNLRSFLIAPLQRVTKYPLLLSRILKSTTEFHLDHSSLWEAKSRIESHLEHINMKTKQEGNPWTLRTFRRESRKNREVTNIEMRETAIKQLGWAREETRFIMEGLLQMAQPTDGQWVKKGCKALRFQNVQALLMVNVRRASESSLEGSSAESSRVRDAALVLIKDKNNGKFGMLREPLKLGHCVVSTDPDCEGTFELLEIRREGFVFRDGDSSRTHHWFRQIKTYSRELGSWKKRRNALPNIMISTIQSRS
ncbi:uncharacterized protein LOC142499860 isoform X2 [Ascaphus truei]|uniref:uncharacterized protein LOC142499860 isoform X2 n=1 Tax=Ascaphus truei TaxID=8439 RepID=UPI003F599134